MTLELDSFAIDAVMGESYRITMFRDGEPQVHDILADFGDARDLDAALCAAQNLLGTKRIVKKPVLFKSCVLTLVCDALAKSKLCQPNRAINKLLRQCRWPDEDEIDGPVVIVGRKKFSLRYKWALCAPTN
ncbi:MAG TPA: hypothetical protein VGH62_11970 [Bradyrhizobium sp.]|jgi:hypothetical protein